MQEIQSYDTQETGTSPLTSDTINRRELLTLGQKAAIGTAVGLVGVLTLTMKAMQLASEFTPDDNSLNRFSPKELVEKDNPAK